MMKDVIIKIIGTQGVDDETDTVEFTTSGKFGKKNGAYYMSYNESDLMGEDEEIKTVLHIKNDNSVVLQRSGGMNSRLIVEQGKRNACYYSTPIGEMLIGIFGEKVENSLNDCGGKFSMCYTIDSNLKLISRNQVDIEVKEAKQ